MPGASIWLLPPSDSECNKALIDMIATDMPARFDTSAPTFVPHITLSSDIDLADLDQDDGQGPHRWLKSVIDNFRDSNPEDVQVEFENVGTNKRFTKKVFVRCRKDGRDCEGLRKLATDCRQMVRDNDQHASSEAANRWVDGTWDPHVSLLYSTVDIQPEDLDTVSQNLEARSIMMSKIEISKSSGLNITGWQGGRVWVVDTSKPINEWQPLAEVIL